MAASIGIDDLEGDDGVDLDGDVVPGDDVLGRHFQHVLAQGDADHLVKGTEDENDAGAFGHGQGAAQAEDDAALVFTQDFDGIQQV